MNDEMYLVLTEEKKYNVIYIIMFALTLLIMVKSVIKVTFFKMKIQ